MSHRTLSGGGYMVEVFRQVSEQELEVANSGSAIYANRFYLSIGPGGVRIAFCEQAPPDKPPIFRTAVILSIQDGIALRNVLIHLMKEPEAAIEKATAAAAKPAPANG